MSKRKQLGKKNTDAVKERDQVCRKCGRPDPVQVHHIQSVLDGGTDDLDNLILLCLPCHQEWHMVEANLTIPFERWLALPPALLILAIYSGTYEEMDRDMLSQPISVFMWSVTSAAKKMRQEWWDQYHAE